MTVLQDDCMTEHKKATHTAYALRRQGRTARWLEIGIASMHSDGQGFDVLLDRMPIGGFTGHILIRANGTNPPQPPMPPEPPSEEDF
jgi:hypothetical protein